MIKTAFKVRLSKEWNAIETLDNACNSLSVYLEPVVGDLPCHWPKFLLTVTSLHDHQICETELFLHKNNV